MVQRNNSHEPPLSPTASVEFVRYEPMQQAQRMVANPMESMRGNEFREILNTAVQATQPDRQMQRQSEVLGKYLSQIEHLIYKFNVHRLYYIFFLLKFIFVHNILFSFENMKIYQQIPTTFLLIQIAMIRLQRVLYMVHHFDIIHRGEIIQYLHRMKSLNRFVLDIFMRIFFQF